jgi:hypothetical protein
MSVQAFMAAWNGAHTAVLRAPADLEDVAVDLCSVVAARHISACERLRALHERVPAEHRRLLCPRLDAILTSLKGKFSGAFRF